MTEKSRRDTPLLYYPCRYIRPHQDRYVFATNEAALESLMVTPKRTFLMTAEGLLSFPKYQCRVLQAWKTR